ncbi:hypothetical protein C8R47DRAFT_1168838 [Mycena vitilis]|nr:hypothetical protein C8R47DRAFT_1168838 [Mycena vitilis]
MHPGVRERRERGAGAARRRRGTVPASRGGAGGRRRRGGRCFQCETRGGRVLLRRGHGHGQGRRHGYCAAKKPRARLRSHRNRAGLAGKVLLIRLRRHGRRAAVAFVRLGVMVVVLPLLLILHLGAEDGGVGFGADGGVHVRDARAGAAFSDFPSQMFRLSRKRAQSLRSKEAMAARAVDGGDTSVHDSGIGRAADRHERAQHRCEGQKPSIERVPAHTLHGVMRSVMARRSAMLTRRPQRLSCPFELSFRSRVGGGGYIAGSGFVGAGAVAALALVVIAIVSR